MIKDTISNLLLFNLNNFWNFQRNSVSESCYNYYFMSACIVVHYHETPYKYYMLAASETYSMILCTTKTSDISWISNKDVEYYYIIIPNVEPPIDTHRISRPSVWTTNIPKRVYCLYFIVVQIVREPDWKLYFPFVFKHQTLQQTWFIVDTVVICSEILIQH